MKLSALCVLKVNGLTQIILIIHPVNFNHTFRQVAKGGLSYFVEPFQVEKKLKCVRSYNTSVTVSINFSRYASTDIRAEKLSIAKISMAAASRFDASTIFRTPEERR